MDWRLLGVHMVKSYFRVYKKTGKKTWQVVQGLDENAASYIADTNLPRNHSRSCFH